MRVQGHALSQARTHTQGTTCRCVQRHTGVYRLGRKGKQSRAPQVPAASYRWRLRPYLSCCWLLTCLFSASASDLRSSSSFCPESQSSPLPSLVGSASLSVALVSAFLTVPASLCPGHRGLPLIDGCPVSASPLLPVSLCPALFPALTVLPSAALPLLALNQPCHTSPWVSVAGSLIFHLSWQLYGPGGQASAPLHHCHHPGLLFTDTQGARHLQLLEG